ncbi:MAG: NUDIX domain-containing protein [Candidatus Pacebacteria bacterium]|jgi:lysophospholipase L1-like esterase/isopentenyldiphosphate isomerase|nr:NUDIX domain-containing protein [Candidatus Paceibacterota bacterium]
MNICIFGDSITWGARLQFRIGWANLLRNHLEKVSDEFFSVYDLGIDKNTSTDLLKRFVSEADARNPEVIIFAIGTNDAAFIKTKSQPITKLNIFKGNLKKLSDLAEKYTHRIIFVGLAKGDDKVTNPLPQSTTGKSYDKANIVKYSQAIKEICEKENLTFIDLQDILTDADFADGLHPNVAGHEKIFQAVTKKLDIILDVDTQKKYAIVNQQDEIITEKQKEAVLPTDIFRVAGLWLTNKNGEILLAQRAFHKKNDPGKWGPASATFVESSENYEQAMIKAIGNELNLNNLTLAKKDKIFLSGENQFFCQWFVSCIKDNKIDFNQHEVAEIRWLKFTELQQWFAKEPHLFSQGFVKYLQIFSQ